MSVVNFLNNNFRHKPTSNPFICKLKTIRPYFRRRKHFINDSWKTFLYVNPYIFPTFTVFLRLFRATVDNDCFTTFPIYSYFLKALNASIYHTHMHMYLMQEIFLKKWMICSLGNWELEDKGVYLDRIFQPYITLHLGLDC